ncbi:MAG: hypothetical protein E7C49_10455 [Clostridium sp.]|nr:hypothetical protein [Clostridium sp.]
MTKHIFDKIALKNTENLSSHNFTNDYTLGISDNLNDLKINDDISNDDIIKDSSIEGLKVSREEENKIKPNNDDENIKLTDLPIFPNLSE